MQTNFLENVNRSILNYVEYRPLIPLFLYVYRNFAPLIMVIPTLMVIISVNISPVLFFDRIHSGQVASVGKPVEWKPSLIDLFWIVFKYFDLILFVGLSVGAAFHT